MIISLFLPLCLFYSRNDPIQCSRATQGRVTFKTANVVCGMNEDVVRKEVEEVVRKEVEKVVIK